MSRSGYVDDMDDQWAIIRWRGAVASAIRGNRGQAFLKEMADALDAMPEKKLVAMELETAGSVCAIGAVGKARGIDMSRIDPEDYETVARRFGISTALAQEIVFENDEHTWNVHSDEDRWNHMREWVRRNLKEGAQS